MTGRGHTGPLPVGVAIRVLLRVTGLVLSVLVLGHFALTHIVTDVAETDASYVASRFADPLFITWDAVMLWTAVVHGAAGVWIVIGEQAPARATAGRRLLVVVAIAMAAFGSVTLAIAR